MTIVYDYGNIYEDTPSRSKHTMHTKKLKQFAAGEFKAKCLQIMDEVQNTKIPVVVTKHGKPVVTIVPFEERKVFPYGAMQHQIKINGDIVGPLREPWNAENDS